MKLLLFPRLAIMGILKNKKFYLPYYLSSAGMIMMYFIIHSLSCSSFVLEMYHGGEIGMILSLGKFVIIAFSLLFLFYVNSFLVKRRYKEFGLYNILGMNKRNIAAIAFGESVYVSLSSIISGIVLGIVFSKLAELGLLNMTKSEISYTITVSTEAIVYTAVIFGAIFILMTLKTLIAVARTKPLELMQSESYGEKPVKANWVFALLGALTVGGAYYMALTIGNPLEALEKFFIAVIMVIVGTYLLFISGSVALCKLLQRNKRYYYRKNHFISVSSMAYRMKRNGAGLAAIAILSTMVLVMISTTGSLYFGSNDMLKTRYPKDTEISVHLDSIDDFNDRNITAIRNSYQEVFEQHRFQPKNVLEYRYAVITGSLTNDRVDITPQYSALAVDYGRVRSLYFVSLKDFNQTMHTSYTLSTGNVLLYAKNCKYKEENLCIGDLKFRIDKRLDSFIENGEANTSIVPSLMVVIPDYETIRCLEKLQIDQEPALSIKYHYAYNAPVPDEEAIRIYREQIDALTKTVGDGSGYSYYGGCVAAEKKNFFSTFGGMFFLGVILSILFIFAAAVIIYYKQISEGYEDQKRFEIMQNVGMTEKDIKSNITSQILTVFFAPLVTAGVHLGFAFPFLWKILQMFHLTNQYFIIMITVIAFVVFGLFYALIYKATAHAYFRIVSKGDN